MVIDIHSHAWPSDKAFTANFLAEASRMRSRPIDLVTRYADYRTAATGCNITVVFGGKARLSGLWADDEDVANYVAQDPSRLIGFLSVDPTQPGWQDELREGHQQLGMKGIKLLPMYAGFFPQDSTLD